VEALEPRFLLDGAPPRLDIPPRLVGLIGSIDPAPLLVRAPLAAADPSDSTGATAPLPSPSPLPTLSFSGSASVSASGSALPDATPADWADGVALPDTPWLQVASSVYATSPVPATPPTLDAGSDVPKEFGGKSGKGSDQASATAPGPIIGPVPGPPPSSGSGTTSAVGPSKVWYQIPIDANTITVKFQIAPQVAGAPLNEEMMVFDPSGRKIADLRPGSKGGGFSVTVPSYIRGLIRARWWLHLEIAAVPSSDSSSQATTPPAMTPFVLVITREYASSSPDEFSSPGAVRVIPLPSEGSRTELADGGSQASSNPAAGLGASPSLTLTSGPVGQGPVPTPAATGPLPSRTAAPLGGVLDDGNPVPAIDRLAAVRVDFDLIDPGAPGSPSARGAAPVLDEPQGVPSGPVVAIRGPGGFPLLASGLVGSRPIAPMASVAAMVPWAMPADSGDAPSPDAEQAEAPGRSRPGRRAMAMSGLSVAMALGFGLVLPDLVSTFQEREPRRFRLRLRRKPRPAAV
jgi:hypothetical protein